MKKLLIATILFVSFNSFAAGGSYAICQSLEFLVSRAFMVKKAGGDIEQMREEILRITGDNEIAASVAGMADTYPADWRYSKVSEDVMENCLKGK